MFLIKKISKSKNGALLLGSKGAGHADDIGVGGGGGVGGECELEEKDNQSKSSLKRLPDTSAATSSSSGALQQPVRGSKASQFKIGDLVNIDLEFELVQAFQVGHGGWCDAMFECLGTTGTVCSIDQDLDAVEVSYPSGHKWSFNPVVLNLAPRTTTQSVMPQTSNQQNESIMMGITDFSSSSNSYTSERSTFELNDLVEISSDLDRVKMLQHGHGEWADPMLPVIHTLSLFLLYSPTRTFILRL